MELKTYIESAPARQALAAEVCNGSEAYLYQLATGRRKAGHKLAQAIERATEGRVSKESLRPDVWGAN